MSAVMLPLPPQSHPHTMMDYSSSNCVPYGLGEGFWEFCGADDYNTSTTTNNNNNNNHNNDHSDPLENSYNCMYGGGDPNTEFYDPPMMHPFVHGDFLPSPESDQENYIGYYEYDTNIPPDYDYGEEDCGEEELLEPSSKPKKVHQRKAANMRERRRMKSINDAFDHLRKRIPVQACSDRRISKVDTLKLAIRYISYLGGLIKQCSENQKGGNSRNGYKRDKIILRCKSEFGQSSHEGGQPLIGHSLSCSNKDASETGSSTLSAKIWIPHKPTQADLVNLPTAAPHTAYNT